MPFVREIARKLASLGAEIWRRDWAVLLLVCALDLFLSRRTWGDGIWVDNDSVCHYAYLRHLIEEFYPATGTYMGFSPKFNMGIPYLLYNTPPGLYLASAIVAKVTGVSALVALKLVVVAAFMSVPVLGWALARSFEAERTDYPKIAAITLSLFSSELFGLEFYFKNGMLNPALGVPLMLATLVAYRKAQVSPFSPALRWTALGAIGFAATLFTHVLSAYMLCVALLAFMFGGGLRALGANVLKLGAVVALGALLTGEWLYPSMKFAAAHDAAYTWSRDWHSTVSDFVDGSLLSSYPVGFDPSFITQSNIGIGAVIIGIPGAVVAVRKRASGVVSCLIAFALAFLIACGPTIHFGVSLLPVYEKLLWYRFVTLAIPMWLMVAAYGAAEFAQLRGKYYPLNVIALGVLAGLAIYVLTTRAVRVMTASTRAQFVESTDDVARWLREHGDRRGRVFSEFLSSNAVAAVSVNYPRHMIPILSGFDEAAGWIYENNPASQALMRTGPFWFDPVPMMDLAQQYDVKYVVAGSAQFVRALSLDPRWREVRATPDLVMYERVGFAPSLVAGERLDAVVADARYERGGGYTYEIDVTQSEPGPRTLVVKTNDSPAWVATVDGVPTVHHTNDDGLMVVDLPPGAGQRHVTLRWSIDEWRRRGRIATIAGALVCALLFLLAMRKREWPNVSSRWVQGGGVGALGLVTVVFMIRARPVDASIGGYGVSGGIRPVRSLANADVGAYYDTQRQQPNRVLAGAWSARTVSPNGVGIRTIERDEPIAALTLGSRNTLTVIGDANADDREHLLTLSRDEKVACVVKLRLGVATELPPECASGDAGASMGHPRAMRLSDAAGIAVHAIRVDSDIRYVEAESFSNTVYDGGCEAFYTMGAAIDYFPSSGVIMTAAPAYHCPIDMLTDVDLAHGDYDVWVLTRTFHPRFRSTRGDLTVVVGSSPVGTFDGASVGLFDFWDNQGSFEWVRLGTVGASGGATRITLQLRRKLNAIASSIDFDAFAFVPRR
jgi:hypothetical protein